MAAIGVPHERIHLVVLPPSNEPISTKTSMGNHKQPSPSGSNFVSRVPARRVGYINRVNVNRVMTVSANFAKGVQTAAAQQEIARELAGADLGTGVTFRLKGRTRSARRPARS
jgi:multidrug efflux pump